MLDKEHKTKLKKNTIELLKMKARKKCLVNGIYIWKGKKYFYRMTSIEDSVISENSIFFSTSASDVKMHKN